MRGIIMVPPEASQQAGQVDTLFYVLLAASVIVVALVFALIVGFAARYRKGARIKRKPLPSFFAHEIEMAWTLGTFFAFLAIFWWVATLRLVHMGPPQNAMHVRVVAKQWMWKIEQPGGAREINALHLPLGVPVELLMTSQDVIHSFYVPAFRVKQDVLPGRITRLWFTPSRIGTYALRCAEYCGAYHSRMGGNVIVMSKADYARWSEGMKGGAS